MMNLSGEKPKVWEIPDFQDSSDISDLIEQRNDLVHSDFVSDFQKSKLQEITEVTPPDKIFICFQHTSKDLWGTFWKIGSLEPIGLLEKLSLTLLSIKQKKEPAYTEIYKGHILHQWMNSQLPKMIQTCSIDQIVEDSRLLESYYGDVGNELSLFAAIIQAHLGLFRVNENSNSSIQIQSLCIENYPKLLTIATSYEDRIGENDKYKGKLAWQEFSSLSIFKNEKNSKKERAFGNSAFRTQVKTIINRGDHGELNRFIQNNIDDIITTLQTRLDTRIGIDSVVKPEGVVFQMMAEQRKTNHPLFSIGQQRISEGNFQKAGDTFISLASQVTSKGKEIADNFAAYAYVRAGDIVRARMILKDLVVSGSTYSSVYWNYLCCLPEEELEERIKTCLKGLDKAPDLKLLNGYIFLSLINFQNADNQESLHNLKQWLSLSTHLESLLLLFTLEYDITAYDKRDEILLTIYYYINNGEIEYPDPLRKVIEPGILQEFMNKVINSKQVKAFDFWLECRKPVASYSFEYWEIKTDFLSRTNRIKEAALSFKEEIIRRINYINYGLRNGRRLNDFRQLFATMKRRSEHWLTICLDNDYRSIGQDIFNNLKDFEFHNDIHLLPENQRILQQYANQVIEDTSQFIAKLSGQSTRLHEIDQITLIMSELRTFVGILERENAHESSKALGELINIWDVLRDARKRKELKQKIPIAKGYTETFKVSFQKEMNNYQELANPLFDCFKRINDHLGRTSEVLPTFTISPIEGDFIQINPLSIPLVFSARISLNKKDPEVRITKVEASLEESDIEFESRDYLQEFPHNLTPKKSLVLTFSTSENMDFSRQNRIRFVITYDYYKSSYISEPFFVSIVPHDFVPKTKKAQFIWGREIRPNEIETSFVGRKEEENKLIDSIKDGQQRVYYIEGIRRVGKSSLLNDIEHRIVKNSLPIIPIKTKLSVDINGKVGVFVYNLIRKIQENNEISNQIKEPNLEEFIEYPTIKYSDFSVELEKKIPDKKVLVLCDDFQDFVKGAGELCNQIPELQLSYRTILNEFRSMATPDARILWIFAGQVNRMKFREWLPGVLWWGDIVSLPINFIDTKSIRELLAKCLSDIDFLVPDETIDHIYYLTAGHPESVQQLSEYMYQEAVRENRRIISPADAEIAVHKIAQEQDTFGDSWYPVNEFSAEQNSLMIAFINATSIGESLEPHQLSSNRASSEIEKDYIRDFISRNIFETTDENKIKIKSIILELWLRRQLSRYITVYNGSVSTFIDIANLTHGMGAASTTSKCNGRDVSYSVGQIIDYITNYTKSISPAPLGPRWATNFPPGCEASTIAMSRDYLILNVPQDLFVKGSDDTVTMLKISNTLSEYPSVNHYVIVTGDKDYSVIINQLLQKGKYVHLICWEESLAKEKKSSENYRFLEKQFPTMFKIITLEKNLGLIIENPIV